ncbi:MAG: transcription termination/antitermination protein NusG [Neomegalonema sp.]|nr:transcription termination/antitermination protein NusG [Neomegalonema sp.]
MSKRWYAVSVLSNFEKKVEEAIKDGVAQNALEDVIVQVVVPTETVPEMRRGKKVMAERRFMPGYVLVHADLTDRAYHLIKDTRNVIGFLGPQGKPAPMRDDEVARMLNQAEESAERVMPEISFEIGETVTVTDGPFETFTGLVEEVDVENARLKVTVSIFGRETPVDLEYTQVQKGEA